MIIPQKHVQNLKEKKKNPAIRETSDIIRKWFSRSKVKCTPKSPLTDKLTPLHLSKSCAVVGGRRGGERLRSRVL